jgi:ATP-dependent DNA ligase
MNCIIEGIDFYQLEAMKYYSPSTSWSAEKKKENAMQKIFSGEWWGAQKRDGIFVMCGRNQDGDIFLRPRAKNTKGEFVNKVDWVPQIHTFLAAMEPGTVFLGELYLPRDEQAKSTSSIMNSLQPRAVKKQQKEEDKLHLYIFDILANKGKSLLNEPALRRFKTLYHMSSLHADYVEWAKYCNGQELWDMLQQLLADGYEGVVITHQDAPYQPGKRSAKVSLKIKKELQETIDCVIIGANAPTKAYTGKDPEVWEYWFNEYTNEKVLASDYLSNTHSTIYGFYVDGGPVVPVTKGWFNGWAGSLKLGLYDGDNLIHVGDLSGITDEVKANWKDYVGDVVEISCMEITQNQQGGWGFRHPKLLSWRTDKPARECTIEQIK